MLVRECCFNLAIYRKIIKVGNSLAVTIPEWQLEFDGVGEGDYYKVESYPRLNKIELRPVTREEHRRDTRARSGRSPSTLVKDEMRGEKG